MNTESKFIAIDVTAAVRDWIGGAANFGFALRPTPGSALKMELDSKESTGTSHEGRLQLDLCGSGTTFYRDADGDTYGSLSSTTVACAAPSGYVTRAGDCDDARAAVNPGGTEVCNGTDDDCDGVVDDGAGASTFFRDADGDTYGNPAVSVQACTAPAGFVSQGGDCNDANALVNPSRPELCNGIDDNCNGVVDDTGAGQTFYRDADGDTYGSSTNTIQACSPPPGYANQAGDCNDANANINPSAAETCNGIDDNCNGIADDNAVSSCPARQNAIPICATGTCGFVCNPGFSDCDGNPANGCETNLTTTPSCGPAEFLGSQPGDAGGALITQNGTGNAVFRLQALESNSGSCQDNVVVVELIVPPGQDYDLLVRCDSCSTAPLVSSSGPGGTERITVYNDESCTFGFGDGADQTFNAFIEVRLVGGSNSCAPWTLRANFNRPPAGPALECGD